MGYVKLAVPDQLRLLLGGEALGEGVYVVLHRQVHELVLRLRLHHPRPLAPHLGHRHRLRHRHHHQHRHRHQHRHYHRHRHHHHHCHHHHHHHHSNFTMSPLSQNNSYHHK